ncbi:MAG: C2 family cysteine protease [Cyanobacteria bacterium J06621_11]
MFESEFQSSSAFLNANRNADLLSGAENLHNGIDAYGLQVDTFQKDAIAPLASLNLSTDLTTDLTTEAAGKSVKSPNGDLLIQDGTTSRAELDEVDDLINGGYYNRDQYTGDRSYTNYRYSTGDARAFQSLNESAGMDRGDYITNAAQLGTIVYRSGADVHGSVGYSSGIRDKNDYFSFRVGKSGTVDLNLTGLHQDAGLALYDTNKNFITLSDKTGTSAEKISRHLATGNYFARVYSYDEQSWNHGATNYSLSVTRQADALESYWKDLLSDSSVENAALNSIKYDNSLSRTDVIGILKSAGDYGSVHSSELTDLRNFYNKAINTQHVAAPLKVLSEKVLFSETSNQWYTGSDSIRASLGNLGANSSTNHLNLLIGKHFLGTDRPAIHRDSSDNLVGSYTRAGGTLFANGASVNDLRQGATGDCYFLAGLGGVANDKNSAISDMFTDNGDGTWSVRFFTNGKLDYVTVDRMMATSGAGNHIYANAGQSVANNNELWVTLAEKAYAQVNESGRIGQDGTNAYGNGGDNGIGWGHSSATTKHITGIDSTSEGLTTTNFFGLGGVTQSEMIGLVNSNRVLTIGGFNNNATNSNAGATEVSTAIQGHAYVVTGYSSSTGRYTLHNPWGSRHLELTFNQLVQLGGRLDYSHK